MTTTKIKRNTKIALSLLFLFVTNSIVAQSDLESWHEVDLDYRLTKKTDIYWNHELRLDNNSSEIKKYQTEAGVEYQPLKRFTVSGGYRYARFYRKGFYNNEHRGIVLAKIAPRFQRFVLEIQTRTEYAAEAANGYIRKEELRWRNKVTLNYKWPTQPLTLYASFEHFYILAPQAYADKYRTIAGCKYMFKKNMNIGVYWGFQKPFEQGSDITYIVGWKVSYTLSKASKTKSTTDNE